MPQLWSEFGQMHFNKVQSFQNTTYNTKRTLAHRKIALYANSFKSRSSMILLRIQSSTFTTNHENLSGAARHYQLQYIGPPLQERVQRGRTHDLI